MPDYDVSSFKDRALHRVSRLSVGDLAARVARTFPEREAVVAGEPDAAAYEDHARLSYAELETYANQFANALLETGLTSGEKVFTYCLNTTEYQIVQLALAKTECVAIVGNPMFPNDVLRHVIRESEPAAAIVESGLYHRDYEDVFEPVDIPVRAYIPKGEPVEGSASFRDFIDGAPSGEPGVDIQPTDVFQIMYTSGTTGPAKGVMHNHLYMYSCAAAHVMRLFRGMPPLADIVGGNFYPLAHIAGEFLSYSCLLGQGTSVLLRDPSPENVARTITQEQLTAINVIDPYTLRRIADLTVERDDYDLSSLNVVFWGWGSIDPAVLARFTDELGLEIVFAEMNGQTECVTDTTFWKDEHREKFERHAPERNYIGEPAPMYSVVAIDEEAEVVPNGVTGVFEKAMRSPCMMAGYYRRPEQTAQAFDGGWFHSGDTGYVDEEGTFVFTGRMKDIIKSGGENVVGGRVEGAIVTHPGVDDVAVFGLPHDRWQEAVTAAVVPVEGAEISAEEILQYCREETELAGFEIPKGVIIRRDLPRTVGEKVKKHILEDEHRKFYRE